MSFQKPKQNAILKNKPRTRTIKVFSIKVDAYKLIPTIKAKATANKTTSDFFINQFTLRTKLS